MAYPASHRFARISAQKVRPIARLIQGKYADEAQVILHSLPHRGARLLGKVLRSALGNAEDRGVRRAEDLVVVEARVDDGPMYKRMRPRARGPANTIRRRTSHIHVMIDAG